MNVVLGVRHGKVENPEGVIYAGLSGYGLSGLGRDQAQSVARELEAVGVAAIYSSPLDRAVQTAEAIAELTGAGVTQDERLYEWRYWARWAGLTWRQLREEQAEDWNRYRNDPGGIEETESLAQLGDRMLHFLDDVRTAHPDGVVVAVTHLEPLRAALLRLTGRPANELFDIRISEGQCVRLVPEPGPEPSSVGDLVNLPV